MFAFVLLAIIAGGSAAPHYGPPRDGPSHYGPPHDGPPREGPPHHNHHRHHSTYHEYENSPLTQYLEREIFDTSKFWQQLNREMAELDTMLADLNRRFPSISDSRVEGNEYKVTISLYGFNKQDIVVKARQGLLIVQAVKKSEGDGRNSYLDVRTLPDCIDINGKWTFENEILTIAFPLVQNNDGNEESATESLTTQGPPIPTTSEVADIEVNIPGRGDLDENTNLLPNETNQDRVEATTYAVDLKDEVELVPINY